MVNVVTSGAIAVLFIAACMGATLKPEPSIASDALQEQAAKLAVDPANTGLLASASVATRSAG